MSGNEKTFPRVKIFVIIDNFGCISGVDEVAEFIRRVAVDKEDIADEVAEFMNQYTKLDYAFSDREAYQYHRLD